MQCSVGARSSEIPLPDEHPDMDHSLQVRRNLWVMVLAGLGLIWVLQQQGQRHDYQVPEVGIAEAKALMDAGALVIDVRGAEQFAYRHIPGAILVPLTVLRNTVPVELASAKDKPVVIYCNEGLLHGPEGTHLLRQAGFTNVVNLKPGIEGWAAAGMAVDKGKG